MPVVPTTPPSNFGFRPAGRPKSWVTEPLTVTDEDGNVYNLTVVADAEGNVISPASQDDVLVAMGEIADRLDRVIELLAAIAEG